MSTSDDVLVGRYRLLQQIGSGGMGVVWRAYDERLGRDVAVKQLHPLKGLDAAEAEVASHRAMREARITARLHHPHAVPVFDVVEHQGRPCLVMQYFPSSSLAELVAGGRTLSQAQAARIGGEVASALAAAHDVGIVHRDVKPANVLVAADGSAKISDFGIAHAMGDVSLTSTGLVTGTPAYLAPEVARGEEATPASDVFSLGSTLYTVLEGHAPFGTHENHMALLHRVASGEVEPPRRSGSLTPLLLRMLAVRPQDRPSMGEVVRELGEPGEPTRALPPAVTAPMVAVAPLSTDESAGASADASTGAALAPAPVDDDLLSAFRDRDPGGPDVRGGTGSGPRRRRALVAVLALVAVVTAGAIAVVTAQGDAPTAAPRPTATGPSTGASRATSPPASPSPRPSSATPSPSTTAPRPSPSPKASAPAGGTPTAAELRAAVRDYYALLPDDRDAGWARLTARYQRTTARNRATYESFWTSVDRVSVSDLVASAPGSVTATVAYDYADGRHFVERTSYRLVPGDAGLEIDRSTVLSSVQR